MKRSATVPVVATASGLGSAMLRVTISGFLDGAQIIDRRLNALEARITDVSPAWPAVVAVFREIARATFETEGASNAGGRWPALAPSTQRDRARQGYNPTHPILQRTQTLMRSVTQNTGDTILVTTPNYLGIGSAVPWIMFHQSTAARSKLPRRAVVDFTTDNRHDLIRPIRQFLTGTDPVGRRQTAAP
jgi:phage gpG-like protein